MTRRVIYGAAQACAPSHTAPRPIGDALVPRGGRHARSSTPRAPVSEPDPGHRGMESPAALPGAHAIPLRQALHDPLSRLAAVRGPLRPGGGQRGLHGPAGRPSPRRRRPRAGAAGRQELRDPARRGRAHGAAKAGAARLPRREDGAFERTDGRSRRARGGELAPRRKLRASASHAAPDPGDHPAGGVRPRPRRAHGCAPRAAREHAGLRGSADQPHAARIRTGESRASSRRSARLRTSRACRRRPMRCCSS